MIITVTVRIDYKKLYSTFSTAIVYTRSDIYKDNLKNKNSFLEQTKVVLF